MAQAILITGQTNEVGTLKQYLIANLNDKNFAWSRTTNGGRGESNAWNNDSYSAIMNNANNETSLRKQIYSLSCWRQSNLSIQLQVMSRFSIWQQQRYLQSLI